MQEIEVVVDFNGIVIFDPERLKEYYGNIDIGTNLLKRFTTTNEGEEVIKQGIVTPIIGINDSAYKVFVREDHEQSEIHPNSIILSNSFFPLGITNRAVISDLSTLYEWYPDENWIEIHIPVGFYSVKINGFHLIENDEIIDFGFEFVFSKEHILPKFSGSLTQNMQVLELK
ncbi:hypothetical protein HH212_09885 [Massilia forsythiae]|uniref:Uncharacterized protein n=1 Tax=Massilia forsythiae TaxID=2728020 RepID=A0A7Z2VW14_9BURK|nr:hypothetical protein [Massilia forsythiae]QJE00291.1 hypothetical protein HH212_09885 [Massilia forsythiae]